MHTLLQPYTSLDIVLLIYYTGVYGASQRRVSIKTVNGRSRIPEGIVGAANAVFIEKKTVVPGYMKYGQLFEGIQVYGPQLTAKLNQDGTFLNFYDVSFSIN